MFPGHRTDRGDRMTSTSPIERRSGFGRLDVEDTERCNTALDWTFRRPLITAVTVLTI